MSHYAIEFYNKAHAINLCATRYEQYLVYEREALRQDMLSCLSISLMYMARRHVIESPKARLYRNMVQFTL